MVLTATFTDEAGDPVDPSTPVEVKVRTPDGTVDGPFTATQASTGVYEYEYTPQTAGGYYYVFMSADGGKEDDRFYANPDETL